MIKECNFKSKVTHANGSVNCLLTPKEISCSGEEGCVIFQIYKMLKPETFINIYGPCDDCGEWDCKCVENMNGKI